MSITLTGFQLDRANGGALPLSAIHFPTNPTVRLSEGYPLPTVRRPPCLFAILAISLSRVTFATIDAAATTSNRESALWWDRTAQRPPPPPSPAIDETAAPNRRASTSHESTYATPGPSLAIALAMYLASSALSACFETLLSTVVGPILETHHPSASLVICRYMSCRRAGVSVFESRTPMSRSLLILSRLIDTPAMTSGPIMDPRPASSTPQTIIAARPAGHLLNRVPGIFGRGRAPPPAAAARRRRPRPRGPPPPPPP